MKSYHERFMFIWSNDSEFGSLLGEKKTLVAWEYSSGL